VLEFADHRQHLLDRGDFDLILGNECAADHGTSVQASLHHDPSPLRARKLRRVISRWLLQYPPPRCRRTAKLIGSARRPGRADDTRAMATAALVRTGLRGLEPDITSPFQGAGRALRGS
jgi:hypothetical protein